MLQARNLFHVSLIRKSSILCHKYLWFLSFITKNILFSGESTLLTLKPSWETWTCHLVDRTFVCHNCRLPYPQKWLWRIGKFSRALKALWELVLYLLSSEVFVHHDPLTQLSCVLSVFYAQEKISEIKLKQLICAELNGIISGKLSTKLDVHEQVALIYF